MSEPVYIGPDHKVWVVEAQVDWEGSDVLGLYTSEDEAIAHAMTIDIRPGSFYDRFIVYEMPVYSTHADFKNDKKANA